MGWAEANQVTVKMIPQNPEGCEQHSPTGKFVSICVIRVNKFLFRHTTSL